MKEGDVVLIKKTCVRRECSDCEKPATRRVTWLYRNARNNPASSAYGKDDCSWCSDDDAYGCEEHANKIWHHPPYGMEICSMFDLQRFPHMGLYWIEETVQPQAASSEGRSAV